MKKYLCAFVIATMSSTVAFADDGVSCESAIDCPGISTCDRGICTDPFNGATACNDNMDCPGTSTCDDASQTCK